MKKHIALFTFLYLPFAFIHCQSKLIFSPDSLISIQVFEDSANSYRYTFTDSCWIQFGEKKYRFYQPDKTCLEAANCDSIIEELWEVCSIFSLPKFIKCVELGDHTYAIMGYMSSFPIRFKHIWILDTRDSLIIRKKIVMGGSARMGGGFTFNYELENRTLIIDSKDVGLFEANIFIVEDCTFSQNGISIIKKLGVSYPIFEINPGEFSSQQGYLFRIKI
ncbi:MAG: hypothetical protein MRZ79_06220 [Bacteroidia bacterium]|nr:hypothetical protein [Bacteroidia bacterium]